MSTAKFPHSTQVAVIVDDLRQALAAADKHFNDAIWEKGDPLFVNLENAAWYIEVAYLKLLTAVETLDLVSLKELVVKDIAKASAAKNGFAQSADGPHEEYSVWMSRYRQYLMSIETLAGDAQRSVTKDLAEILRASAYSITNRSLFGAVPQSEEDVHQRIECILKCVFPDLRRKPRLTKAIKHFEPDTGLPSINTLIEYKYIARKADAAIVADQILADTRGYNSREWTSFVYVIYETERFRPEHEWNQLLRECDVSEATSAIVLSGEPVNHSGVTSKRPTRKRKVNPK